jgi:hypothetical protein
VRLFLLQSEGVEIVEWPERSAPRFFRVPIPARASDAFFVPTPELPQFETVIETDDYRLVASSPDLFVYEPIPPLRCVSLSS